MDIRNVSQHTSPTLYEWRGANPVGMVIHGSGGTDSLRWLQRKEPDPKKKSSADFLIRRDGVILRLTPYGNMAYHSGPANWGKYPQVGDNLNRTHWGVELEMPNDGKTPPTPAQYNALAQLWVYLYKRGLVRVEDTCTHAECALPFGRKVDPSPWSWALFTECVNIALAAVGAKGQVVFRGR